MGGIRSSLEEILPAPFHFLAPLLGRFRIANLANCLGQVVPAAKVLLVDRRQETGLDY